MAMIELVERRLACDNSRFTIYLDRIRTTAGSEVPDYLVVAPKVVSKDLITRVAVLPCCDGRLSLVRLFRHPVGVEAREIPRGLLDANESPPASALRELEVETGLTCAQMHLLGLGRGHA